MRKFPVLVLLNILYILVVEQGEVFNYTIIIISFAYRTLCSKYLYKLVIVHLFWHNIYSVFKANTMLSHSVLQCGLITEFPHWHYKLFFHCFIKHNYLKRLGFFFHWLYNSVKISLFFIKKNTTLCVF